MSIGSILYIGGFELPDKNPAAHRVLNNGRLFKEMDFDVVFCGVDRNVTHFSLDERKICGFYSYPQPLLKNGSMHGFGNIKKIIKKHNINIIIAYNLHFFLLKKLFRYCRKNKLFVIGDLTEWYNRRFSFNPIRFVKWVDTNYVMKHLNKKFDAIISISSFLKKYYSDSVNNIIVLPPLVDITEEQWRQNTMKKSDSYSFVYSGFPGISKDGIVKILKLITDSIEDFEFNFVGMTYEQFISSHPDANEVIENADNRIVFRGRVSHDESIRYLLSSDCCLINRTNNRRNNAGFPTKFVECVTSGILTVSNNFSDIGSYSQVENVMVVDSIDQVDFQRIIHDPRTHELNGTFDYRNYVEVAKPLFEGLKKQ